MAWLNAAFAAVGLAIGFFVSFLKDKKKLKTSCGGEKDNRDNRDNFFDDKL